MNKNIRELLTKRFPAGEYALLEEVRNAAGFGASRSADAMAMGLWPSRGLRMHGIEVKVSRSDWLREVKNPEKAEAIFKYCDYWWLVTGGENVAKLEEIPDTWGWLCVKGSRLVTMKEAPTLKPTGFDREFVGALLKRATMGMTATASIQDEVARSYEAGKKIGESISQNNKSRTELEFERLQKQVKEFETLSGISIARRWDLGEVGQAVKDLVDGAQASTRAEESLQNLLKHVTTLQGFLSEPPQSLPATLP